MLSFVVLGIILASFLGVIFAMEKYDVYLCLGFMTHFSSFLSAFFSLQHLLMVLTSKFLDYFLILLDGDDPVQCP